MIHPTKNAGAVMAAAMAKLQSSSKSDGNSQYFPKGVGYGSGTPAQKSSWNFQQVKLMVKLLCCLAVN